MLTYIFIFVIGLAVGSFANVCIYRIPAGISIARPSSRCLHCGTSLRLYDNIPILGFLFLKGRCRHCGEKISLQYPAVELICGVSFLLLAYRFPDHDLQFVLNIVFFTFLLIISGIDFNLQIIPHSLSLPLILFSLSVSPFNMLIGADIKARMINASASLLGGWAALYFIGWITGKYLQLKEKVTRVKLNKEALGDADPILLAGIGAFIGWKGAVIALFSASVYGLAIMLPVILAGKWNRSKPFAFGPLLAGGAVTFVLIGRFIESFYF